jgi:hypothetical protein
MLQARRPRVQIPMRSLDFSIDLIHFQLHYGPGVDLASNTNEYQESSGQLEGETDNLTALFESSV